MAHVVEPNTVVALAGLGVELGDAAIWLRDRELIHAVRDTKADRGAALPLAVWLNLPEYLEASTPYLDTGNNTLLYVFDLPDASGKVAIRINHEEKIRDGGQRKRINSNFIVTGGIVTPENIKEKRYVALQDKKP